MLVAIYGSIIGVVLLLFSWAVGRCFHPREACGLFVRAWKPIAKARTLLTHVSVAACVPGVSYAFAAVTVGFVCCARGSMRVRVGDE